MGLPVGFEGGGKESAALEIPIRLPALVVDAWLHGIPFLSGAVTICLPTILLAHGQTLDFSPAVPCMLGRLLGCFRNIPRTLGCRANWLPQGSRAFGDMGNRLPNVSIPFRDGASRLLLVPTAFPDVPNRRFSSFFILFDLPSPIRPIFRAFPPGTDGP